MVAGARRRLGERGVSAQLGVRCRGRVLPPRKPRLHVRWKHASPSTCRSSPRLRPARRRRGGLATHVCERLHACSARRPRYAGRLRQAAPRFFAGENAEQRRRPRWPSSASPSTSPSPPWRHRDHLRRVHARSDDAPTASNRRLADDGAVHGVCPALSSRLGLPAAGSTPNRRRRRCCATCRSSSICSSGWWSWSRSSTASARAARVERR